MNHNNIYGPSTVQYLLHHGWKKTLIIVPKTVIIIPKPIFSSLPDLSHPNPDMFSNITDPSKNCLHLHVDRRTVIVVLPLHILQRPFLMIHLILLL